MEFVPLAAMASLVYTLMTFLKAATNRDVNGVVTQLVAWLSGVVIVFLVAQTDFATTVNIGTYTLATLNGSSLLFLGLSGAGIGGVANKYIKARDNFDTARDPNLLPGTSEPPAVP